MKVKGNTAISCELPHNADLLVWHASHFEYHDYMQDGCVSLRDTRRHV
jgi:hypothetical protein